MKKLLILVMLLSMGLAGVASAGRGNFTMYRWDNNDSGTSVQPYQRDFSQMPTSKFKVATNQTRFPTGNPLPTTGVEYPNWDNGTNFGCRFEGWLLPPADGNYTFWISADDGAELWLSTDENRANAVRICNVAGWTNQREWGKEANQKSNAIALKSNKAYFWYSVYKEGGGGDGMSLAWGSPEAGIAGPTVINRNFVTDDLTGIILGLSDGPVGGVEYEAYDVTGNADGTPADLTGLTPSIKGYLAQFGVGAKAGTDNFSIVARGIIRVAADGVMGFGTSSDDGSRLFIGDWWTPGATLTEVVRNDGWHGMQVRTGSIPVKAGLVGITVTMFEGGGGEGLEVYYYSDTIPFQQIPAAALLSRNVANDPVPASGAMAVAIGTPLSWTKPIGKEGVTNNLMFGESGGTMTQIYTGTGTTFTPTLAADKEYVWRVDTSEPNSQGPNPVITKGRTWGFSTRAVPVTNKLVAYWPLDADLSDATGNLVAGKYFSNDSSAPVFEPGMKGNAIAVNIADTANSQYAKLADWGDATLGKTGISAAMPRTIACWVKNAVPMPAGANPSDWCTIFGFTSYNMTSNGLGRYSFDFDKRGGQDQYCIHRNGGEWNIQQINDQWHFLVATYDGGVNRVIRYYSDGKKIGETGATSLYTQDIVHIGKRAHSNPVWRGWVDEARIYNYQLTDKEVYELYVASGGTPSTQCFGPNYPAYDFNRNCVVDTADLLLLATEWMQNNLVN